MREPAVCLCRDPHTHTRVTCASSRTRRRALPRVGRSSHHSFLSPPLVSTCRYIEFCADRLLVQLGVPKRYNAVNPFDWMDLISLQGKSNFFEKRVGEYAKAGVGAEAEEALFDLSLDF